MLLESLYFILPAYFANMAPVFYRNKWKKLAVPVDFGLRFRGKRLFGANKTWRGLFAAVLWGIAAVYIQVVLHEIAFFERISLFDYTQANIILLGSLLGLGAILGDLAESFVKRRMGIESGKPWVPFDQLDFVIGALILASFVYLPPIPVIITILIASPILHLAAVFVGYLLGIRESKF
ncbi:MAG: CDP-2,3-bis-(O-geranylgeranyl)-sn-glycerol synthase [archaeon]